MKIFYHGDMDGIVSANVLLNGIVLENTFIQNRKRAGSEDKVLIEFDYNKQQAIDESQMNKQEHIYFVDCSPDKEILDKLINSSLGLKIFVIDHHVTRQEYLEQYFQEGKIEGMFYNGASASLITYLWREKVVKENKTAQDVKDYLDWYRLSKFNQDRSEIPLGIKLVNSWDIWDGLYADAEPFKIVFESKHFKPTNKDIAEMLYNDRITTLTIQKGYIMKEQMDTWAETYMERYGYEVEFEGHKFFVANLGNANSKYFGNKIKDYDAVIPYCYNGDVWTCSIYSDASKDFDCAEFATRFGGGGHKKAAGFRMKNLPEWLQ